MTRRVLIFFAILGLACAVAGSARHEDSKSVLTFVVAGDVRQYVAEPYRNPQHFLGALQALKRVGPGSFMVSPGDMDPPGAVRDLVSEVLGADYPWYPVMGNHELEAADHLDWLRHYNAHGTTLPHVVRKGPPGSEETTYAFDWADCHFVALNQYYNGQSDSTANADMVPELLAWLEQDLAANTRKHVFVFGHVPLLTMFDMDNGRVRHQAGPLEAFPPQVFRLHQLLLKYRVAAYFCGHTHNASFANINGLWQFDSGHARGLEEDSAPSDLFAMCTRAVEEGTRKGVTAEQSMADYFAAHKKQVQKSIYYMKLGLNAATYDVVADDAALQGLARFYEDYRQGGDAKAQHVRTFWENAAYAKSSFLKVYVSKNGVKVEIYRDDARGGPYALRKTVVLGE